MKKSLFLLPFLLLFGCSEDGSVAQTAAPQLQPQGTGQAAASLSTQICVLSDVSISSTLNCSNSPGPFITLSGELALSGLGGKLIFRNNAKGTHEHIEDLVFDVVLIPAGQTITFSKQPPLGGVGGNPHIWFQLTDVNGGALSDELYLGRCVQGN